MKCQVISAVLLVLFANSALSEIAVHPKYDDENSKTVLFIARQVLHLSCSLSDAPKDTQLKWQKEGVPIGDVKALEGRTHTSTKGNTHYLRIQHANDEDSGNYSCVVSYPNAKEALSGKITAVSKIAVKVPTNINVVEGEKLRIHCIVAGKPYPEIHWYYANETYNATYYESTDRVILDSDTEKGIENAILRIEEIQMYDRGRFKCIGKSPVDEDLEVSAECMIRIKDKYAALWPFLGICAEVFVLCAVIFIYEKKRNKTELEESDTDQSPDQKNTPDHEKDSNLRHRQ